MKIETTSIFFSILWYFEISVFEILRINCIQPESQKIYFEISIV